MRARVAITSGRERRPNADYLAVPATYIRAVEGSGGLPLVLPLVKGLGEEWLRAVDGLLLTGGDDVDPALFGQERHQSTAGVDLLRDGVEIELARAFFRAGKPILAICRGIQVLAVSLGGTLCQHVPDLARAVIKHGDGKVRHRIRLETGSRLMEIYGRELIWANSTHHQSVDKLPVGFTATAWSLDGVVEGMECGQALGVQWHPERLYDQGHACIFEDFMGRCRRLSSKTEVFVDLE